MTHTPSPRDGRRSRPRLPLAAPQRRWLAPLLGALLLAACTQVAPPLRPAEPNSLLPGATSNADLHAFCAVGTAELKLDDDAITDCSIGGNGMVEIKEGAVVGGDASSSRDRVQLRDDAGVRGGVAAGDEVKLEKRASVGGDVASGSDVELQEDARVRGSVRAAGQVKQHRDATVNGTVTAGADVPAPPTLELPRSAAATDGSDVKLGKRELRTLAPGRYDELKVEEGAVLTLVSGHYVFAKIEVHGRAAVAIDLGSGAGRLLVDVVDKVRFSDGDEGGVAAMAIVSDSGSASDVLVRVQGDEVILGKRRGYVGTFVAAEASVTLDEDATLRGALLGKKLELKKRTVLYGDPVDLDAFRVNPATFVVAELRVTGDLDDAEEDASGEMTRHSPDLELAHDPDIPSDQLVGVRFTEVPVPWNATVVRAWLQFQVDEPSSAPVSLRIQGEATDVPLNYSNSRFDLSSRPRTVAAVAWEPPAWNVVGAAGPEQRTPDLAVVIQEIVGRPDWSAGNALALMIEGDGRRVAEAYDGDPAGAPLLHLEYVYDDSVTIDAFHFQPAAPLAGRSVDFRWHVSDANGDEVRCELDADGDGTPERVVDDCAGSGGASYAYPRPGIYDVTLTAIDGTGATSRVTRSVGVVTPETVFVGAAGDIACDPLDDDFHNGFGTAERCRQMATSDLMLDPERFPRIDAVLPLGDIQYEDAAYDKFLASYDPSWGRLKHITYPVVGNHEYLTPGGQGYFDYFGAAAGDPARAYYSFDLGTWHVVVLNSNCSKAGGCRALSPQEKWLREDLAANPSRCTLALWHHPRFSSGGIGDRDWTIDLWRALQDHGAELVLVGHDHNYERFAPQDADGNADPDGLRQFVAGMGGRNHTSIYSLQPNSEVRRSGSFGVLKLALHPDGYDWEFVGEAGDNFRDKGSEACR